MLNDAICTSCGANVKVDPTKDAAICDYCGAAYIVEDAITNYNIANAQITAQTVNVNVGGNNPTEQSMLDYAKRIIDNNPTEAIQTYKGVLRANPDCYNAWLGIAEANVVLTAKGEFTRDIFNYSAVGSTHPNASLVKTVEGTREAAFGVYIIEGYQSVISTIEQYYNEFMIAIENARRCVPANEKSVVEQFFDKNVTMAKKQAEEYLNQKLLEQKTKNARDNRVGLVFAAFFILGLVVAGVGLFGYGSFGALVTGVIICAITGWLFFNVID